LPAAAALPGSITEVATGMAEVPEGFDHWDPEDQILPRIQIVQPTSKFQDATAGTFRCNLDGEAFHEIRCVPIFFRKGMVLWSQTQGEDPLCKSDNGIVPSPDLEQPYCTECHRRVGNRLIPVCNYAKWSVRESRREPPQCSKTYTLMCLDLGRDEAPFLVSLHGTSVKPVRALLSKIWTTNRPLYAFACTLGLDEILGAKGKYYVLRVSSVTQVDKADLPRYSTIYNSLKTMDLQASFDADKAGEAPEGAGDGGSGGGAGIPVDGYDGGF
jgi:hypothetical protein